MRNAIVLFCVAAASVMGQTRRAAFVGAPDAAASRTARPVHPGSGVYRHHGYVAVPYGGWWGGGYDVPREVVVAAPAKESPALVVNKDFVGEKLAPQTTFFPEGMLPAAKRTFEPEAVKDQCMVRFRDGETVAGKSCAVKEDTLSFVTARGRLTRVSLDLVEQY